MICDECETVAHCLKNGCVPKQPPSKDEVLKMAPEALENELAVDMTNLDDVDKVAQQMLEAIWAIKQALAAPAQEPVVLKKGECWPEDVMQQWDYFRKLIADGDRSSFPRDWFESLADMRLVDDQVMRERDEYHEIADDLAARIAEMTGVDIGEHSSANFPWRNALDAADDWIASPQAAAPAQEPVAWMDGYRNTYSLEEKAAGCEDAVIPLVPAIQHWSDCAVHNEPAYPKGDCDCGGYTTPPAAQPALKPLTDEQIDAIVERLDPLFLDTPMGFEKDFARAIEAAHGIKGDA